MYPPHHLVAKVSQLFKPRIASSTEPHCLGKIHLTLSFSFFAVLPMSASSEGRSLDTFLDSVTHRIERASFSCTATFTASSRRNISYHALAWNIFCRNTQCRGLAACLIKQGHRMRRLALACGQAEHAHLPIKQTGRRPTSWWAHRIIQRNP